jgi:hypothetical protein
MSYSDSTHFFDKLSYKILFVLNYGLRENREFTGAFRTEANLARVADRRGRGALTRTLMRGAVALAQTEANEWGPADRKTEHMLLIRCNAKYHITTGCEIETSIWMSYSDSTHFFDKLSYKILFVLNYGLRDMTFARLAYLQQFSKKQGIHWSFSHRGELGPGR